MRTTNKIFLLILPSVSNIEVKQNLCYNYILKGRGCGPMITLPYALTLCLSNSNRKVYLFKTFQRSCVVPCVTQFPFGQFFWIDCEYFVAISGKYLYFLANGGQLEFTFEDTVLHIPRSINHCNISVFELIAVSHNLILSFQSDLITALNEELTCQRYWGFRSE